MSKPAIGVLVMKGKTMFRVTGHRCATGMTDCPHGDDSLAAVKVADPRQELCLPASKVTLVEP